MRNVAEMIVDANPLRNRVVEDDFLDTCNRFKLTSQSGILTYMDTLIQTSQDHLGVCHNLDSEMTFQAHTKFVASQTRDIDVAFAMLSKATWGENEVNEALEKDTKILQKDLFKVYKELGRKHRLVTNWTSKSVKTIEELLQVINLSSMYIAKNGRLGGANFIVIGSRIYEMLLSHPDFLLTENPLERRISKVGQLGINYSVFLNLDDDDALVMGKNKKLVSTGAGIYLGEFSKEVIEHHSPTTGDSSVKLVSRDCIGEYGYHPEFNFFTPTVTW